MMETSIIRIVFSLSLGNQGEKIAAAVERKRTASTNGVRHPKYFEVKENDSN